MEIGWRNARSSRPRVVADRADVPGAVVERRAAAVVSALPESRPRHGVLAQQDFTHQHALEPAPPETGWLPEDCAGRSGRELRDTVQLRWCLSGPPDQGIVETVTYPPQYGGVVVGQCRCFRCSPSAHRPGAHCVRLPCGGMSCVTQQVRSGPSGSSVDEVLHQGQSIGCGADTETRGRLPLGGRGRRGESELVHVTHSGAPRARIVFRTWTPGVTVLTVCCL